MKDFQNIITEAVEILRRPGAVILIPTETVYGLVCRAADETACRRIFELKQRPFSKVLGWFVSGIPMLEQHNVIVNDCAADLISRYTPGALTLISKTSDGGTQGYRIPDHPLLAIPDSITTLVSDHYTKDFRTLDSYREKIAEAIEKLKPQAGR